MEREIKFRGKRVDKEEFAFGDLLTGMGYKKGKFFILPHLSYYPSDCNSVDGYEVIPETISQYTGLKDKNGKEIYEGDILRGDEYPFNCDGVDNYFAEIVWADNVCGFYRLTHKKPNSTVRGISHGNWEQLDEDDIKSFEVIGNIHDNPELLKDGRD